MINVYFLEDEQDRLEFQSYVRDNQFKGNLVVRVPDNCNCVIVYLNKCQI